MALTKNRKLTIVLILAIVVIASFFRLWQLDSLPVGLFPDEAANGQDALLILSGQHSPFFERGLGRETLYFYLLAGSIGLFGIGVWQIHIISALIGILTVIVTWLLAKRLFNERVAFLASFFLATSIWHTTLSRTGFRAILIPLLSTLFFYFVYLAFKESSRKKRTLFAILAGLSLGLGFYTYISFRAMVIIIGLLAIIIAIINRGILKNFWREIVIGLTATLLILTPLIGYFINHPDSFVGRAGYVSIFNPDLNQGDVLGTFFEVSKKTFWMFFTEGDLNWRHNVSGFSMLNPWVAFFFALGFLYSLVIIVLVFLKRSLFQKNESSRYWFKYFFLIIWFLGMLGPELLSAQAIPHGLRAIGAIPVVFFFPALLLDFFWRRIKPSFSLKSIKIFLGLVLGFVLVTILLYDYSLYFGISANSPGFYYAYRSDLTTVSNYLNERNYKENTYLVLDEYSVQTPDFLTAKNNQPYLLVDPATSYQIKLQPDDQIIFTQSTIFDTKKFEEYHPETKIIQREFNQFRQEIMRVYEY